MIHKTTLFMVLAIAQAVSARISAGADDVLSITIDGSGPRVEVSPTLYGIFFEEINHAGEGGLYAEMVLNRDFEMNTLPAGATWAGNLLRTRQGWHERKWFGNALHGWTLAKQGVAKGSIRQDDGNPLNENHRHSLRLTAREVRGRLGVANGGFWGMNVQAGKWYDLSFYARTEGTERFDLAVSLESGRGQPVYAAAAVKDVGGPWRQYRCSLHARASDPAGRLVVAVDRPGTIWFDVVSLFPRDTFKGRPNGMRADVAGVLADLKPSFVRFPGGAVAGGLNLDNRFQWKRSIGDIARRRGTMNLWGYYSTYGLGFHEYLQWCEDIGADALYVCNPGMSDGYRNPEAAAPGEVGAYVQEALDALEYALGPAGSKWGTERAANGHPAPFPLRYIEIGNESGGERYLANYGRFYHAVRARYPDLTVLCNQRGRADAPIDIVDDHFYAGPDDLFALASHYDAADRKGPKVYVGEYACSGGVGEGNLLGALAEAAFMMGLERNGDVVKMASYAPLLFNVNDVAWPVSMIALDSSRVAGRGSYYVQKLFARNRPDEALATRVQSSRGTASRDLYALAGLDKKAGQIVLKVVNRAACPHAVAVCLRGLAVPGATAAVTTLSHADPAAENTLDDPEVLVPTTSRLDGVGPEFSYTFQPYSLTILRMALKR